MSDNSNNVPESTMTIKQVALLIVAILGIGGGALGAFNGNSGADKPDIHVNRAVNTNSTHIGTLFKANDELKRKLELMENKLDKYLSATHNIDKSVTVLKAHVEGIKRQNSMMIHLMQELTKK